MTRRLTVLFSFFEALVVAGIGIAIPLVPLTILWAVQFGFAPDWMIFGRTALDLWLVGHGVDLTVAVDPVFAASFGQPAGTVTFTMAALGFALLTLLLGVRAGARIAETGHRVLGLLTATGTFAIVAGAATWGGRHWPDVLPSRWQGVLLPTAVFGLGLVISLVVAEPDEHPTRLTRSLRRLWTAAPAGARAVVGASLRAGIASAAITILGASVGVTVLVVGHYATLIRMYEALHGGWAGGLALTAGQLAILPNLVIWGVSWFVGPGFALGAGSSISPLGTVAGPLPAIPVLGALPQGELTFGFAFLAVPVVAGFLSGVAARGGLARGLEREGEHPAAAGWRAIPTSVGGGLTGALVLGLLAWASAGSAGPGRFGRVGPDPLAVGLWAAVEFTVAIGIGLTAAGATRGAASRAADLVPVVRERAHHALPANVARREKGGMRPLTETRERAAHDDVDTAPITVVGGREERVLETVPPGPAEDADPGPR